MSQAERKRAIREKLRDLGGSIQIARDDHGLIAIVVPVDHPDFQAVAKALTRPARPRLRTIEEIQAVRLFLQAEYFLLKRTGRGHGFAYGIDELWMHFQKWQIRNRRKITVKIDKRIFVSRLRGIGLGVTRHEVRGIVQKALVLNDRILDAMEKE